MVSFAQTSASVAARVSRVRTPYGRRFYWVVPSTRTRSPPTRAGITGVEKRNVSSASPNQEGPRPSPPNPDVKLKQKSSEEEDGVDWQSNSVPELANSGRVRERNNNPVANAVPFPYSIPVGGSSSKGGGTITSSASLDAALTTVVGLAMVFAGGVAYLAWYKKRVLDKIELAFAGGYDPALELANHVKSGAGVEEDKELAPVDGETNVHLRRKEQPLVDRIIQGDEPGHYFLITGPKGSGKTSMILDAMKPIEAEGVAICEFHPDLEVLRLRLGKAINFEYNEDTQTGLFSRRDPREGGPALDIERAMNKLEKVALRLARIRGKPLVLIFNNIHLLPNNDEGRNLLLQLQQRAETWAESGILTMVFCTDDFWPLLTLRQTSNRMQVLSTYDFSPMEAFSALRRMRKRFTGETEDPTILRDIVARVGGRMAYLSRAARAKDMSYTVDQLLTTEKAWLLSQIGLIPDMDDDVMDDGKVCSLSWLLMKEFVRMREKQIEELKESNPSANIADLPLPVLPYWRCRQIMTRPDFLEGMDRLNIIQIDVNHEVRPESMLVLEAATAVVNEEGFDDLLNNVLDRVNEIESLHRTRELTFKDLATGDRVRLEVDKGGSRSRFW